MHIRRTSFVIASLLAALTALPTSACRYDKWVDFKNIFATDLVIDARVKNFEGGGDQIDTYKRRDRIVPDFRYAWMELSVEKILSNRSDMHIGEGDLISIIWGHERGPFAVELGDGILVLNGRSDTSWHPETPTGFPPDSGLRLLQEPCSPVYHFARNNLQWRAIHMVFDSEGYPPEVEADILGEFLHMNGGPF